MKSFSEVVAQDLADGDYDKFVDHSIVGADRKMAIDFLRMMPKNMRGDFVYVDPAVGKILSNRVDLVGNIKFTDLSSSKQQSLNRTMSSTRHAMSYPPEFGNGGPFIRNYSYQGENALYGYATPPCDTNIPSRDSAGMYFNAYSGNSGGSVLDAGLAQGLAPYDNQTLNAFINIAGAGNGYLFHGWTNLNQTWHCGTHLGMMFGTLVGGTMEMLAIGVPNYDPTQYQLPPSLAIWSNAAWNFFPVPTALRTGANPGTWNDIPSPCLSCYVARMFTIAEAGGGPDGSCYGYCNGSISGRWDQVVGGNLTNDCSQVAQQSERCTIEYQSNGSWIAGLWDIDDQTHHGGVGHYYNTDQDGMEGLNDNYTTSTIFDLPGTFVIPLPPVPTPTPAPPCTPDSYGYCVQSHSSSMSWSYCTGPNGNVREYTGSIAYIIGGAGNNASYTMYTIDDGSGSCTTTFYWDPNEPSQDFGDPNLP